MKILEIVSEVAPAPVYGVGRSVACLSRALTARGHDVHVLTTTEVAEGTRDGLFIHRAESPYPFAGYSDCVDGILDALPASRRLLDLWGESDPFDVIAVHDVSGALAGAFASRIFGAMLVATLHGTEVGRCAGKMTREQLYVADMERWIAGRAHAVVVPSRSAADEVVREYRVEPSKIAVIPDAATGDAFKADVDVEEFRRVLAAPDEKLLLFAGRLTSANGPDLLLDAVPELLRRVPRLRVVLAGDGPLAADLAKKIESQRLSERIRLLDHVGTRVMSALLRAADALVVPSRYEAGGIGVLEAVLHGTPVVAARASAIRELPEALPGFRTYDSAHSQELAGAVAQVMERVGDRKRDRVPEDARVPSDFRWESVARLHERAYQGVCARAR